MQFWNVHSKFSAETTIESRVQVTAPIINDMIAAFERGEFNDGTQNFQDMVLEKIRAALLLEDDVWTQVDVVGVHPDNRERAGLVPIDVHNLLMRIFQDGFMMKAVDLLACEIPPTDEGEKWRVFNEVLAKGSAGLLPPVTGTFLQIVTARGSHTTAAVRCYKFGVRAVHDELALDGKVSSSKICEKRASMKEPLAKGMPYTIIRWQLVQACPKLMSVLARTGNLVHGVHREATALQGCMSVLHAYQDSGENWQLAIKTACQGQPPEFAKSVQHFKAFVDAHAGGVDGRYLQALELYERGLGVKRKILPEDLSRLA